MSERKKGSWKKWVGGAAFVLLTAALAALPALTRQEESDEILPSVLSTQVELREIESAVHGGGSLMAVEPEAVRVPRNVKVTGFLVNNGDMVSAGDAIATVDKVSVMYAVTEVQKAMDEIKEKMNALYIPPGALTADDNGKIYAGGKAIAQDKMADYAEYMALAEQHSAYEEILLELFRLYHEGVVKAGKDGLVDSMNRSVVDKLSGTGSGTIRLLASHTPLDPEGEDDGESYRSYVGVVNAATGGSWDMLMNPDAFLIEDFASLAEVDTTLNAMTARGEYSGGAAVYERQGEEWVAVEDIAVGDILLFTYDGAGSVVWVIRLGKAEIAEPTPTPTPAPTPAPGGDDGENERPGMGSAGGAMGSFGGYAGGFGGYAGGFGGYVGGFGGGAGSGQKDELYTTERKTLCMVVPLETMELTVTLDEQDVGAIHVGMTAEIAADALLGESWIGTVKEVSRFGGNNGGSSKFAATLTLRRAEGMLPGMNASARFVTARSEKIPALPVAALTDAGKGCVVYTALDEKSALPTGAVEVTVGRSDGEWAEIIDGLAEGQTVWYIYYDTLVLSTGVKSGGGMFG